MDHIEMVDGKGAWIKLGNWYELPNATGMSHNWIIDAGIYRLEGTSNEEVVTPLYAMKNFPNPFNPETKIAFSSNKHIKNAKIDIFNIKGEKVTSLIPEIEGLNGSAIWNGKDSKDNNVSSGVYFYQLSVNDKKVKSSKCLLLK